MPRSLRVILFFALSFASVFLTHTRAAVAQQGYLYIKIDNGFYACQTSIPAGVHTASVWVTTSLPLSRVRFSAVVPFLANFIADNPVNGIPLSGNTQTGIDLLIPACLPAPYELIRIIFNAPAPLQGPVTWEVAPRPIDAKIELADCTGLELTGSGDYGALCEPGTLLGPYHPTPADGATNVSVDQLLSFVGSGNVLLLGLDPQLGDGEVACAWYAPTPCVFPFDPGTLLPNTTYYWQALNACIGCEHGEHGASDIWSFTTADVTVPVGKTTWGAVKALYRE